MSSSTSFNSLPWYLTLKPSSQTAPLMLTIASGTTNSGFLTNPVRCKPPQPLEYPKRGTRHTAAPVSPAFNWAVQGSTGDNPICTQIVLKLLALMERPFFAYLTSFARPSSSDIDSSRRPESRGTQALFYREEHPRMHHVISFLQTSELDFPVRTDRSGSRGFHTVQRGLHRSTSVLKVLTHFGFNPRGSECVGIAETQKYLALGWDDVGNSPAPLPLKLEKDDDASSPEQSVPPPEMRMMYGVPPPPQPPMLYVAPQPNLHHVRRYPQPYCANYPCCCCLAADQAAVAEERYHDDDRPPPTTMATPPVPPRPVDYSPPPPGPPPVPPLPPNFKPDIDDDRLMPHFENPLIAPRPHKIQPELSANMVRQLDDELSHSNRHTLGPPQFPFAMPTPNQDTPRGRSPLPPPANPSDWSPWNINATPAPPPQQFPQYPSQPYPPQRSSYYPPDHQTSVDSAFSNMSLGPNHNPYGPRPTSSYSPPRQHSRPPTHNHARTPSGPRAPSPRQQNSSGQPSLTIPLPTIPLLTAALPSIQRPDRDPASSVAWIRDVLGLVERAHQNHLATANAPNVNSTDIPVGPVRIGDPQLQRLVDVALPLVQELSSPQPFPSPVPPHVAEAIYLRATCAASGAYPQFIPHNPRTAFRDFEQSAKNGYHAAWFKLGRDYENFGDAGHAKDCFERGVKYGVESCLYRMGMAHLMGQLGLQPNPEIALSLLHRAATLATVDVPQPAYVYGLLLLSEFSHIQLPQHLFAPFIPPGSTPHAEARKHLERAAYLNFAPAQYKLGHSYEYATAPFPFDALLSVQYYSLASQQGEVEADMALSKWFLCGAEGAFEKDEGLAWTFADKAARKGLPSAEFAMGYYAEVGVGGPKDIEAARKWYNRAAEHGNADAKERLQALSQPTPQALSRTEHETLTDTTLVRKRTQAKQRSDAAGAIAGRPSAAQANQIMENVRRNSLMGRPPPKAGGPGSFGAPQTSSPPEMGRPMPLPGGHSQQPLSTNSTNPRVRPPQGSGPSAAPPLGPSSSHSASLPTSPAPSGGAQQQQRPFANTPRYSLADPGSGSAAGSPRPSLPNSPSPAGTPPLRRPGGPNGPQRVPEPGAQNSARPNKPAGPQTFAEMGIASTKASDDNCLIM
ncbi:hypothetical protein BXZ70DRAFT_1081194 [Cristinia sonorae]|uniref:HCP-like protein n=1 Tax=Cristinia sonorae TaxID=1940300 RepID=A0A8K0UDX4_9AGAR|nr:hypothetical protein BXZ70DRAFT_1081194 [Cristinia sonorae]